MKNKIVLNVSCEGIFNYIVSEFVDNYEKRKKTTLDRKTIAPGLTFSKVVGREKETKNISMATVKLLKYKYPYEYSFEYLSKTYYRVTEMKLTSISENKCELLIMNHQEKLKNGEKPHDFNFDGEEIEAMTFFQKYQYKSMERQIRKGRKNALVNKKK
ncbi:MAG: DUF3284 domain-containing protein [Bulleidia sp.]